MPEYRGFPWSFNISAKKDRTKTTDLFADPIFRLSYVYLHNLVSNQIKAWIRNRVLLVESEKQAKGFPCMVHQSLPVDNRYLKVMLLW